MLIVLGGCRRHTQVVDVVGAYSAIGVTPADGNDVPAITLVRDRTCVVIRLPVVWHEDFKAGGAARKR
jgi:hypothetical protein